MSRSDLQERPVAAKIDLLGPRRYPVAQVTLPETIVGDFSDLLKLCQGLDPSMTPEDVVKGIWRYGVRGYSAAVKMQRSAALRVGSKLWAQKKA